MRIDLNADLGESYGPWTMGDDEAMLDIVTSANVACGFHGGDPVVMKETVARCAARGVAIGAHPSFDDRRGFGRRRMDMPGDELAALLVYQIGALQATATAAGQRVTHAKLHGALANMASEDAGVAAAAIGAVKSVDPALVIVAMASTELEHQALALDMPIAREIYADRAYNDDGTLVSRAVPGAVIHDPVQAAERVVRAVDEQAVTSVNGVKVPVVPETVCVHGDNPAAVALASRVRERLETSGVSVVPFAG